MNENDDGQVVHHSLFETNSDWHMTSAINRFKRANPTCVDELRVIMVDKDLNEIRVLQAEFVTSIPLVCSFHVIKYFDLASRKPEYGRIAAEDHNAVDHLLHSMVYARDAAAYDQSHESFRLLCERVGFTAFYAYVQRNWQECQVRSMS
jgi:hypothetical protein